MSHVWTLTSREYLQRIRKRSFLVSTILGPLLMAGFMIVPILLSETETQTSLRVTVVDATGLLFHTLREALDDTLRDGRPRFVLEPADEAPVAADTLPASLAEGLEQERTDICLVLPPEILAGASSQYYSKKVTDFDVFRRVNRAVSDAVVARRLRDVGFDPQRIRTLTRPVAMKTFKVEKGGAREKGFLADFLGSWILMMILYTTILLYGNAIQRSIIEEKGSRIIEILLSATTPARMMWGKVLGVGAVGLTQYAIWGAFGFTLSSFAALQQNEWAEMGRIAPQTILYFILFFVLGYFLYSSLSAAIGAAVNSDQEAQQLQWPVIMLLVVPLIMATVIMKDPSGNLATIMSLIPFFAPLLMFMRTNIYTPPAYQIVLSIVLMLLTTAAIIHLTARIYRVGILMYGKRPTLPEIVRWARRA